MKGSPLVLTGAATLLLLSAAPARSDLAPPRPEMETPVAIDPLEVSVRALDDPDIPRASTAIAFPEFSPDSLALSDAFAGFHIATNGAHSFNDTVSLRGVSNTPIFGTPAVAVYLDETPLLGTATLPDQLSGLAGARLFRGPGASGNFGYAGALLLQTPRAEKDQAPATLRGSIGDFSLRAHGRAVRARALNRARTLHGFGTSGSKAKRTPRL